MAQPVSSERLRSVTAYWEALHKTLVEHVATDGNANTLDVTSESAIWATTGRAIESKDPPELLDFDLHSFWSTILLAAQNYDWDNPKQDTLFRQVLYVRELGVLHKLPKTDEGPIVAQTSNGQRIWIDLPFLVQDVYRTWLTDFWTMSTTQRKNLSSFVARLASVGVCGEALVGCMLLSFREALETPRRLTSADPGSDVPVEDLLPALLAWMRFAPHKLYLLVRKSFNNFPDVQVAAPGELALQAGFDTSGFSAARWAFWKMRLAEMEKIGGGSGARHLEQLMEQIEIELEGRSEEEENRRFEAERQEREAGLVESGPDKGA